MTLGDLKTWKDQGLIRENQVMELTEIMDRSTPMNKPALFISTGAAVQDAFTLQFIKDKLSRPGEAT